MTKLSDSQTIAERVEELTITVSELRSSQEELLGRVERGEIGRIVVIRDKVDATLSGSKEGKILEIVSLLSDESAEFTKLKLVERTGFAEEDVDKSLKSLLSRKWIAELKDNTYRLTRRGKTSASVMFKKG